MLKTEANDPINAVVEDNIHFELGKILEARFYGLTKREYFAGLAMSSYYGGEYTGQSGMQYETIANNCVEMADALITSLNKEQ